jgi:peptidyl-tRNA hydrolase
MDKTTLNEAVQACKETTREALQTVYDSLNQGQQKKIIKVEKVKALFDLYEVNYNG